MMLTGASSGWWYGLSAGFATVAVVVIVVAVVLSLAARVADQARTAAEALPVVRDQTDALRDVGDINASAIAILRAARAARKALTGS